MKKSVYKSIITRRLPHAPAGVWDKVTDRLPEQAAQPAQRPVFHWFKMGAGLTAAAAVIVVCAALAVTKLSPNLTSDIGLARSIQTVNASSGTKAVPKKIPLSSLTFSGVGNNGAKIPAAPGSNASIDVAAFDEKRVLSAVEAVVQATVLDARLKNHPFQIKESDGRVLSYNLRSMIYTLRVDRLVYSETDDIRQGETLMIEAFSVGGTVRDYPLAVGGEYVLNLYDAGTQVTGYPVGEGDELIGNPTRSYKYSIVDSVYPQIQLTSDGGYLFYDWYKSLLTPDTQEVIIDGETSRQSSGAGENASFIRLRTDSRFLDDMKALVLKVKGE